MALPIRKHYGGPIIGKSAAEGAVLDTGHMVIICLTRHYLYVNKSQASPKNLLNPIGLTEGRRPLGT
jgi:hypothetical protein